MSTYSLKAHSLICGIMTIITITLGLVVFEAKGIHAVCLVPNVIATSISLLSSDVCALQPTQHRLGLDEVAWCVEQFINAE